MRLQRETYRTIVPENDNDMPLAQVRPRDKGPGAVCGGMKDNESIGPDRD